MPLHSFGQCTEVRFVSLLSGRFTTMAIINPLERKLAKRISMQWSNWMTRTWNSYLELTLLHSFLAPPLYNFILIYINMMPFFLKLNSSSLFTSQKKLPISHKKMDKCHHQRIFPAFFNQIFFPIVQQPFLKNCKQFDCLLYYCTVVLRFTLYKMSNHNV